jgi:hypothetical protein
MIYAGFCGIVSVGLPLSQAASPLYGTLAPLRRGFFMRVLPRAVQPAVVLYRWVCRCRSGKPDDGRTT